MPKKIKFESFRYRFLIAAQAGRWQSLEAGMPPWPEFLRGLDFQYLPGAIRIAWGGTRAGSLTVALDVAQFYTRGDDAAHAEKQETLHLAAGEDPVKLKNQVYFADVVRRVADASGYQPVAPGDGRLASERDFHDSWAAREEVSEIDVRAAAEACTAPEMRYIASRLGDLRGKRLLDVGCGLGEASVYFALRGADVTALDLSAGMLDVTRRLAEANGVSVTPHLASAEDLRLPADQRFDVIYAGNLLHHVDVDRTLALVSRQLAPDGVLVTWDPLAYNPVINVYRFVATEVRTPDEHPLTWRDIQTFRRHFAHVETRYFWLSTLLIFVLMAVVQRRNPNQERFWKVIIREADRWRWLYTPLEKIDRATLWLLPPLRLLCWNVVIFADAPRDSAG